MSWLDRTLPKLRFWTKRDVPDNLWSKCKNCGEMLFAQELEKSMHVCPHCDHHDRIGPQRRFDLLFDEKEFEPSRDGLKSALNHIAVCIPKSEAKKMATEIVNVGTNLEQKTGSTSTYHAYALMGSYYQSIAEADLIKSQNKSFLKQAKTFLPMTKTIELISNLLHDKGAK